MSRAYTQLVYRPMLEVFSLLRAKGFTTFIVSGGGVDFVRAFSGEVYGVPLTRWSARFGDHPGEQDGRSR